MYSLRKFSGRAGNMGQPLPDVFATFAAAKIHFRHGSVSMIAGAPGSYKSTLALNLLAGWAGHGKSALYFSADSDEFTVAKRMASIMGGCTPDEFEADPGRYTASLARLNRVAWVYRSMNMDVIAKHIRAFDAVHGDFPDIIFADNLIDAVEDPTDWGGMISFLRELDAMARETKAHVCVLHHASEIWAKDHPGKPPPSWAILGKVTQIPRLVVTVAENEGYVNIACVKNTNGPQDKFATHYQSFYVSSSLQLEAFQGVSS